MLSNCEICFNQLKTKFEMFEMFKGFVHSGSVRLHQGSVGEGHSVLLRRPHLSAGHRREDRGNSEDAGKRWVVF